MTDADAILREELRQERLTRLRPIEVRTPSDRDAPYSGGVILNFDHNAQSSSSIDINRRELEDLVDKALVFLHGKNLHELKTEAWRDGWEEATA
jgi:hypothetical protein